MIKEVRCLFVTLINQVYRLNKKKKKLLSFQQTKTFYWLDTRDHLTEPTIPKFALKCRRVY